MPSRFGLTTRFLKSKSPTLNRRINELLALLEEKREAGHYSGLPMRTKRLAKFSRHPPTQQPGQDSNFDFPGESPVMVTSEMCWKHRKDLLSPAQKLGDGFGAGADLQFFIDAADVSMHGFVADAELLRDFLVHQAVAQQVEHLLFAFGQVFRGLRRGRRLLEGLHDFARDVHGHRRAAAIYLGDGFEQL